LSAIELASPAAVPATPPKLGVVSFVVLLFCGVSSVTAGAAVSIRQEWVARLSFPAASCALTWKLWVPWVRPL
jgi:hypothetical protein